MYTMWDSVSAVRLPNKPLEKNTSQIDNFSHMGSRDPPPIIMNFGLLQFYEFLIWLIKNFLFCEALKMAISFFANGAKTMQ
jgi:hypothetical protein